MPCTAADSVADAGVAADEGAVEDGVKEGTDHLTYVAAEGRPRRLGAAGERLWVRDQLAGIKTWLMAWITPLDAITLALMTRARLT